MPSYHKMTFCFLCLSVLVFKMEETEYHLERKQRQTDKQNAMLEAETQSTNKCKTIKTEGNFENDFWTKSYNSRFWGFQEVT